MISHRALPVPPSPPPPPPPHASTAPRNVCLRKSPPVCLDGDARGSSPHREPHEGAPSAADSSLNLLCVCAWQVLGKCLNRSAVSFPFGKREEHTEGAQALPALIVSFHTPSSLVLRQPVQELPLEGVWDERGRRKTVTVSRHRGT